MIVPRPCPGLVVHFSYLWRHEFELGENAGRKHRPALILATGMRDGMPIAYLLPISSTDPGARRSMQIPATVNDHLGLDAPASWPASWIVIDDINVTAWPGFDLRQRPDGTGRFDYGEIPARLFDQVKTAVRALRLPPRPTPR